MLTRTLDAPRSLVWKAWTEKDRLMRWFGPKGVTMPKATLDLRPGGVFHYCMRGPDGKDMWGKWTFREVVAPEKLVVVVSFSDEKGGIARHPFAPDWPLETLSTTTFTESGGKTTMTLHWQALEPTDAELKAFDGGHDSMRMGWGGTMEQLEAYLAANRN